MLSISIQNKIPAVMKKQSTKLYDTCKQYLNNLWQWCNEADQTVVMMLRDDILNKFAAEACIKFNADFNDFRPLYERCKLFGGDIFEKLYVKWLTTEKHPVKPKPASGKGYDKKSSDIYANFLNQFKQFLLEKDPKFLAKFQRRYLKTCFDNLDWKLDNPYWEYRKIIEIKGVTISLPYAVFIYKAFCWENKFENDELPEEIFTSLQAKGITSGKPQYAPIDVIEHFFGTPYEMLVTLRQFNQFAKYLRTRAHIKHKPVVKDHAKVRDVASTFRRSGAHTFF